MKSSINTFRRGVALMFATIFVFGQFSIPFQPALAVHPSPGFANAGEKPLRKADPATTRRASEAYGKLPLSFERNQGQADPSVKFLSQSGGQSLRLEATKVVLNLRGEKRASTVSLNFLDANPAPRIEGEEELLGKSNYLVGADPRAWRTNIPTFAKVRYRQLWPGVDAVFYGNPQRLEYDFVIAPGASPCAVKLRFEGARRLRVDAGGDLILQLADGELRQRKPVVYQTVRGDRREIASRYVVNRNNEVSFNVGRYDHDQPLVIDPVMLYSTAGIGGVSIAVDLAGNAYLIGSTNLPDFPLSQPFQQKNGGEKDVFVAKLSADGSTLVYSTYLGGAGNDEGRAIAVDAQGNAYVTGESESTNFPGAGNKLKSSAMFKSSDGGGAWGASNTGLPLAEVKAFAISPRNPQVIYAGERYRTYIHKSSDGGTSWTQSNNGMPAAGGAVRCLTADPANPDHVYASIEPYSTVNASQRGVFETTDGGMNWSKVGSGLPENFIPNVIVFAPSNPSTIYAADGLFYIYKSLDGGNTWKEVNTRLDRQEVMALAVDPSDPSTLYAGTRSSERLFKSVDGGNSWKPASSGLSEGGVVALAIVPSDPSTLYAATRDGVFKSVNGGAEWKTASAGLPPLLAPEVHGFSLLLDPANPSTLYAGVSYSGSRNGVYKSVNGGDAWSYLGKGLAGLAVSSLAINPRDSSILYAATYRSGGDAFVAKLDAAGSAILYSRYLGGIRGDSGEDIAVDALGRIYVTGRTGSEDFPTTPNAIQTALGGDPTLPPNDAFITKLNADASVAYSSYFGGSGGDGGAAMALDGRGIVSVLGTTASSDFPTRNGLQTTIGSMSGDAFLARFDLTLSGQASLIYSSFLGGSDSDSGRDVALDPDGNIYVLLGSSSTDLALSPDAFQRSGPNYLAKLNPSGGKLLHATRLGTIFQLPPPFPPPPNFSPPSVSTSASRIAVDNKGNVYLTGEAGTGVPVTQQALQPAKGDLCIPLSPHVNRVCYDAFLMKLNPTFSALIYSSYLGGDGNDIGSGIAMDVAGNVYVTGASFAANFPVTPNSLARTTAGGFVSKFSIEDRDTRLANVSAASFARAPLAPESIVAAFGAGLATGAEAATTMTLPTSLLGTSVVVKDSAGTEREAPLFFVSPAQINYQLPEGTAMGTAAVAVKIAGVVVATELLEVANVSPALFTFDATGRGLPAAFAQRIRNNTTIAYEPVARFDAQQNRFVPVPIDLGPESDVVYLVLYGTGFRRRSALSAVKVQVGGAEMTINYAGPQLQLVGLDQINVFLPRSLAGRGEVDVVVTVDGKMANMVGVSIR